MNIALISFDEELYCLGIRVLSSCMRRAGHTTQIIFLPPRFSANKQKKKFIFEYSQKLMDSLAEKCKDADLIGMSLMTNQFIPARQATRALKERNIKAPIIWGGIEPTVEPEVCIAIADMVCLGEGESALTELVDTMNKGELLENVKNVWSRRGTDIIRNEIRPLTETLDEIPLPDYSCENHFIGNIDTIKPLTKSDLVHFPGERFLAQNGKIRYPIMTSRGCPFACTYCCNSIFRKIYSGQKILRWRSTPDIINELKMIQQEVGSLDMVFFVDDNFTGRNKSDLENFCVEYKKQINVPFYCQVSPLTIDKEKIEILFKYGCAKLTMGVETGSERIAAMYNRKQFHKAVPQAIALIEQYRNRMVMPPTYQLIIDNPFETIEDTLQTLRFAVSLPRPWNNPVYSLMLFPGTELYEKAVANGLITDKEAQVYARNWLEQSRPFFQIWIALYRKNFPRFLMRFLTVSFIVNMGLSKPVATLLGLIVKSKNR